jgi:hypothetical protein
VTKRGAQRVVNEPDGGRVRAVLGLGNDQLPTDEFHPIARREEAAVDEPIVLDARPSPERKLDVTHAARLSGECGIVNVADRMHLRPPAS